MKSGVINWLERKVDKDLDGDGDIGKTEKEEKEEKKSRRHAQRMGDGKMDAWTRSQTDKMREKEAVALVNALTKKRDKAPMKICVMVRVRRVFDVSLSSESFKVMIHVITCWLCEDDAVQDCVEKSVAQWSVEDVARWLSSQQNIEGADAVAQRFREEDVDGEALLSLTSLTRKDIQEHFDLSYGKASKLLAAVCQLAVGGSSGQIAPLDGDFVYDADPEEAFYEPNYRPRIAIRDLSDGSNALDGVKEESYFYRSYVPATLLNRKFGKTVSISHYKKLIPGIPGGPL